MHPQSIWRRKNPLIVLVNPSIGLKKYDRGDIFRTYLSLGTLASALRDRSFLRRFAHSYGRKPLILDLPNDYPCFDIEIVNLSKKPAKQSIEGYLRALLGKREANPFMICCTVTSGQLDEATEVASVAKRLVPSAMRLIGGPHVSICPSTYLNQSEYQVACVGEGVETIVELALEETAVWETDLSQVSGIAYKDKTGEINLNAARHHTLELDDYPFPSDSLDLFVDNLGERDRNHHEVIYVLGGHGCPYHCAFCAQHAVHRGVVRARSARNIVAEIEKLNKKGFRRFAIVQETFLADPVRVDHFVELVKRAGFCFEWTVEARADQVRLDRLKTMRNTGLRFIQIGLESADQGLLDALGKKIKLEQVKRAIAWCRDLRINTALYLLVGLPGQGWQSILRSAKFIRENVPFNEATMHVSVAIAVPYPGTRLYEEGSVRILPRKDGSLNWPERTPEVTVTEGGEFSGVNHTETDDMTPGEIIESMVYLDDYCHFLLHSLHNPTLADRTRGRVQDFADKAFHLIERRTIRDHVVRAQENLTAEKRRRAYHEILNRDAGKEGGVGKMTTAAEEAFPILTEFLTEIRFFNGFQTMGFLSIQNRVKWMKLCAILWAWLDKVFHTIGFEKDHESLGKTLASVLDRIEDRTLNARLRALEHGREFDYPRESFVRQNKSIRAFDCMFYCHERGKTLTFTGFRRS